MKLPPGYERVEGGGFEAFALPELRPWVEEALERGTLHGQASRRAELTFRGRGPVHVITVAGRRLAIRHYYRGGALARVLGDRYLRVGEPRPLTELRASEAARTRGVPTPRVVAGAVHPGGLVYRADLVTEYVPDARDLASVLSREPEPDLRQAVLEAAGALIARMAAAGLRHPDLNARNVLLTPTESGLRALLLDLDRCAVAPPGQTAPAHRLLARLERSLRKEAASGGLPGPSDEEMEALRRAIREGGAA